MSCVGGASEYCPMSAHHVVSAEVQQLRDALHGQRAGQVLLVRQDQQARPSQFLQNECKQ